MRLRKKWWARPEMESSNFVITNPKEKKGQWRTEFSNTNPIHLELGCGRGRFITTRAELNSDINYIGIDLKDEVIIYALRKIVEKQQENVRLIPMNIGMIEEVFDVDEIERIYINFCNPWPKLRHNKRRLTHSKFLDIYKGFLKRGSEVWFKTDDHGLFDDSVTYFEESGFRIRYMTYDLHHSDFQENVVTEYEEKFTALGMETMFLVAVLED